MISFEKLDDRKSSEQASERERETSLESGTTKVHLSGYYLIGLSVRSNRSFDSNESRTGVVPFGHQHQTLRGNKIECDILPCRLEALLAISFAFSSHRVVENPFRPEAVQFVTIKEGNRGTDLITFSPFPCLKKKTF